MRQWLTPATIPASSLRRVLLLPDDEEWLAVFQGVLLELATPENWEPFGSVSPEDTAAKWLEILEEFWLGEECP